MPDVLATLSSLLGTALLHFLWQGVLFAVIVTPAMSLLRDARPQTRYALACVAMLVSLLAPALTLGWLLASHAASAATVAIAASAPHITSTAFAWNTWLADTPSDIGAQVWPWLVPCWAAGVALLSMRTFSGLFWITRLRHRAWADPASPWQGMTDRMATRLGMSIRVSLRLTNDAATPLAVGWWRPMVLLPAALTMQMPAPLLEALIAHELAHIRRHDYLINLLQRVVEALLFYHPVVWWLSRRIRIERELIADALAADALGERRRLALALSELDRMLDATAAPLPHLAPAAQGGQLMSRIQSLLRPRMHASHTIQFLPLLGLPLFGLALAGAGMYAHATTAPTARQPVAAGTMLNQQPPVAPVPPALPAASAPTVPTAPPVPAAPAAPTALPAPPALPAAVGIAQQHDGNGYALVRKGDAHYLFSGEHDDTRIVETLRSRIVSDFLLVRKNGQSFVVRDSALISAVNRAWAPLEPLNDQMRALQAQMTPHQHRLEDLQAEMERIPAPQSSPEMVAANERLHALASRQAALASQQRALAQRMRGEDGVSREDLERQMDRLSDKIEAISSQMEAQSAIVERQSGQMQQQGDRMRAMGDRMQAASKPMRDIGEAMEVLGTKIQRAADEADGKTRRLIEGAFANGLAQPVT